MMARISEAINQPRKRPEIIARALRASAARRRGTKYSLIEKPGTSRAACQNQPDQVKQKEMKETNTSSKCIALTRFLYHDASIMLQFPHVQLVASPLQTFTYLNNPRLGLQFCTGTWHVFHFEMRKSLMPRSRTSLFSTGTWIVAFPHGWMAGGATPVGVHLEKNTGKIIGKCNFDPFHICSFTLLGEISPRCIQGSKDAVAPCTQHIAEGLLEVLIPQGSPCPSTIRRTSTASGHKRSKNVGKRAKK